MIRNNKAALMNVVIGIAIITTGAIAYIVADAILMGPGTGQGIFDVANSSNINVTGDPGWSTVQNLWHYTPIAIMIAGLVYIILSTQRLEPQTHYYGGV